MPFGSTPGANRQPGMVESDVSRAHRMRASCRAKAGRRQQSNLTRGPARFANAWTKTAQQGLQCTAHRLMHHAQRPIHDMGEQAFDEEATTEQESHQASHSTPFPLQRSSRLPCIWRSIWRAMCEAC